MAIVSTMPEKGQEAKVYDIPDADLASYTPVEGEKTQHGEKKEGAEDAQELGGSGSIDLSKMEVQAYGDVCICWYRVRRRWYYRYVWCWQSC